MNHSVSYAVCVESVTENTDYIYDLWKTDPVLREKNDYIGGIYQMLGEIINNEDKYSEKEVFRAKVLMLIANQCLEGIYFMSGFMGMYCLGRAGKVLGTVRNIKFINRDEDCHTSLISSIFKEVRRENKEKFDEELVRDIYDMIDKATELEIKWGKYITDNNIFGIDDHAIEKYIKYLANDRLKKLGLEKDHGLLYPDCSENNLAWITPFKSLNDTKTDFFQADVQNYKMNIDLTGV